MFYGHRARPSFWLPFVIDLLCLSLSLSTTFYFVSCDDMGSKACACTTACTPLARDSICVCPNAYVYVCANVLHGFACAFPSISIGVCLHVHVCMCVCVYE